jgi:hypothetical protein
MQNVVAPPATATDSSSTLNFKNVYRACKFQSVFMPSVVVPSVTDNDLSSASNLKDV